MDNIKQNININEECKNCPKLTINFKFKIPTCPLNNNRYTGTDDRYIGIYGPCNPKLCESGTKRYNY